MSGREVSLGLTEIQTGRLSMLGKSYIRIILIIVIRAHRIRFLNSKKINCPLSRSDTITAEKLEHQLLPPGSRWKITFLLRWENGPCFRVFGVWIHSPLGH